MESRRSHPYQSHVPISTVTREEKKRWEEFKNEWWNDVRDMIAGVLRSMSNYQPWWLAIRYKEAEVFNAREEIYRLSGVLN